MDRLYPGKPEDEVPIGHITNGVHVPTWLAPQMQRLYDRHLGADWHQRGSEAEDLARHRKRRRRRALGDAPQASKPGCIEFVRQRAVEQAERRGESRRSPASASNACSSPDALTIGFARRFATYKRANLVLTDIERLAAMVNDPERPVQFVFAGKAHPHDEPGKERAAADRRTDARPAVRRQDRVRRGLRHQRRPPPRAGRRRLAQQSAPAAGGLAAPAARRSCSTAA